VLFPFAKPQFVRSRYLGTCCIDLLLAFFEDKAGDIRSCCSLVDLDVAFGLGDCMVMWFTDDAAL